MVIGALSGLYYRELTKSRDFPSPEFSQLPLVHTHVLTLGFIVLLIVLVLQHLFKLSQSNLFNWFFWTYNIRLILTACMLPVRGPMTVVGSQTCPATAGISGLGHIFLTLGMVLLFLNLRTALKPHFRTGSGAPQVESSVL